MLAKIIVLSDTHKNQKLLRKAITNEPEVTHIFHLGDNYEDLDDNIDLTANKEILKVPGIFHPGYYSKDLPAILQTKIENWKFTLLHNLEDWNYESTDLLLFGHTHRQYFSQKEGVHFLNPGHLKSKFSRNQAAGYATVEVYHKKLDIKIKDIEGEVLQNPQIERR